jgi:hypothetical protein
VFVVSDAAEPQRLGFGVFLLPPTLTSPPLRALVALWTRNMGTHVSYSHAHMRALRAFADVAIETHHRLLSMCTHVI